jgi:hypothetical protein
MVICKTLVCVGWQLRFRIFSAESHYKTNEMTLTQEITILGTGLIMPAMFSTLCFKMKFDKVPHPPYIPFFILFGSVAGWMLTYSAFIPLRAMGALAIVLYAITSALAAITAIIYLLIIHKTTMYHIIALVGNIAYLTYIYVFIMQAHTPH